MIKKKKKGSRYDPWLHALRSEEEEQRWQCGGAKTISPLSMRVYVCVCLNFEDNDTKKASKIMESSITERAREFMESSRKKKRKKKRKREPESFWNQVEVKEKKKKKKE